MPKQKPGSQRPLHDARPTLRLLDELNRSGHFGSEVSEAIGKSQFKRLGPITALDHPIISRATRIGSEEFEDSGTLAWRNRIKCVSQTGIKSPWFEIRADQWRGAVVDPKNDGSYWLVAAGLRREGDTDNFYDVLARMTKQDLESYLPSSLDENLMKLQSLEAATSACKQKVLSALLNTLSSVDLNLDLSSSSSELEMPACYSSMGVRVDVDRVDTEALITIQIEMENFDESRVRGELLRLLQSPIEREMERWDASSSTNPRRLIYFTTIPLTRLEQLVNSSRLAGGADTRTDAHTRLGISHSHFTKKSSLVDATVFGLAVRAICGQWFVPSQDPTDMPSCEGCKTAYADYVGS